MINDAIQILKEYYPFLLKGSALSVLLALSGTIIGAVIGLITGVIRTTPLSEKGFVRALQKVINFLIGAYTEIFRGTPMMVQAMVIYWGYAYATGGKTLDLTLSGILIVSINTGAYMTEIVRGGIISIDKGQFEGASAIGMSHWQTMVHVVIPQVIRNILPSTSNEFINNIKDTAILNVIGVSELYYYSSIIKRTTFKIFQTYLVICVIYFVITFTITQILRFFERKLEGSENYAVIGSYSKSSFVMNESEDETK